MADNHSSKETKRDKSGLIILSVVIVFVVSASLLAMGAVPKIFQTASDVNQTNILLAQRIAITDQQKHEDEARYNQTQHEDLARDRQVVTISKHMDRQIDGVQRNLTDFITASEKRSEIGMKERGAILHNISMVLDSLTNKSADHDTMAVNMNKMQIKLNNITEEILDVLNQFGKGNRQLGIDNKSLLENLTRSVEEIRVIVNGMSS